ncbi:F-box only protein 47-like [Syngnathoides biaculeatus]|uniref:F-box only protein 47-like n=1 Tax=Syngnathoides biaculeatus TaxID=300417 RepID=UPI002ADE7FF9|nr:F-box only protein 47-like [Syngnathoides biaculeatus]XP_061698504.1 F-box only protein 47-like [Syngnathoides biaculeatus]XP_061698505.1 F-box only protein 47-like [Syngnathoides biaculeatus]
MVRGKETRTPNPTSWSRTLRGRTVTTRSQLGESRNVFQKLPLEVFHMILDNLAVLEVSVLCLVSKQMNRYVVDYISTLAWKRKLKHRDFHNTGNPEHGCCDKYFRNLGVLFKRCTMLLPTKERLNCILYRFSQVPCFLKEECAGPDCIGLIRYGIFLQAIIAGWDEFECQRVFQFLCKVTDLVQKIEMITTNVKPGLKCLEELEVRYFCRMVLLDLSPNQSDHRFWLLQLLKPLHLVKQANLLLILYGPQLSEGPISWQDLVERELPHDALWNLARAVLLLFNKPVTKEWNIESTLAVFQEIIVIPQPWHGENIARLLVVCGKKFCSTVLTSRAQAGFFRDVTRLIVYIVLVCEKDGYEMNWVVNLVHQLHKNFNSDVRKLTFIRQLENMFTDIISEVLYTYIDRNRPENGDSIMAISVLLEASSRFHAKFLHMLLK